MKNSSYNCQKTSKFYDRISFAKKQAENAIELPLIDRLRKYSFIQRYSKSLKSTNLKKGKDKDRETKTKRNEINDSSVNKKRFVNQNDEPITKQQTKIGHDMGKQRKKFKRICTISSMEDRSDISINLEDLNEKVNWDFLDNL